MLRNILKWTILSVSGLLLLAVLFYAFVYFKTEARINKEYHVKLQSLNIPTDSLSYAKGMHIATNRGCRGCHGPNLAGGEALLEPGSPLGVLQAANLTSGKGGIHYTDQDWIRVLRHGLNRQNKSVWFMPAHEMYHISNQELGQLICYLKQQPAVDQAILAKSLKPMGRILTFFNKFPLLPAEKIDHNAVYIDTVQKGVTAEYGAYLATICQGCHGPQLKGTPARNDKDPAAPDITSTGHPGKWREADFITTLHTGNTPEGKHLSDAMPWKYFTFTDDELKAILLHLKEVQ
jgi:mono/diheme cytochrome c family protein